MSQPSIQAAAPVWLLVTAYAAGAICLVLWAAMIERWWRGARVLPYQPRRRVPWGGIDVVIVVAVYVVLGLAAAFSTAALLGPESGHPAGAVDAEKTSAAHPIARLLTARDGRIVLLCILTAVVVVPIAEELLFRVLLQGWLESAQRRFRRRLRMLWRLVPGAAGPIVLSSLLFSLVHFRAAGPIRELRYEVAMVIGTVVVGLWTAMLAIILVRARVGATAADLGWVPKRFFADVGLGLWAALAVVPPIFLLNLALNQFFPKDLAPDPIPIFFFALALGTLYHRTHRIVASVVLHMSLNASSLAMAWLAIQWSK